IKLSSLTQHEVRTIGAENLCNSTLRMLRIREFLASKGWSDEQTNLALMQIIARAVYPFSELKTVSYLRENTALAELFNVPKEKITKDALYKSAHRLWDV
ncbi:MAG: transposase, partial [Bacteroidaceae bacterium]